MRVIEKIRQRVLIPKGNKWSTKMGMYRENRSSIAYFMYYTICMKLIGVSVAVVVVAAGTERDVSDFIVYKGTAYRQIKRERGN